jgi:xanthine dehydrogenase iron-sulfur cluster and FAD-binding subunit A
VKPPPFAYHRPGSLEEAARLLADLGDEAKVIAGGQSLVPLLNFRLAAPSHLVDINGILGLGRLDLRDGVVEVGATVRDARLLVDPVLGVHPLLVEATGWIAHPVIRNRGTVCGSLAHADPAAELPATLALLGGDVEVVAWRSGALARRRVPAADLFVGPLQTSLQADELMVAATFPPLAPRTGWAVEELARRHGDFALAGVILTVTIDEDGVPTAGRAAYLSCAPTPVVLDLDPALVEWADAPSGDADGAVPPSATPRGRASHALYELVASALDPTGDIHASGDYRRHLAATLTTRALGRALARARAPLPNLPPFREPGPREVEGLAAEAVSGVTASAGPEQRRDGLEEIVVTVNGVPRVARAPARRLLSDLLRHDLRLTGTHVGCEHGVCGACTVLVDGEPVRSCLTFAVMVDGARITTVEGLGGANGELDPVQRAFRECHGLQCGFCTPGFLLLTTDLLTRRPDPSDDEIADALGGNLCRCTGYVNIVRSVRRAGQLLAEDQAP